MTNCTNRRALSAMTQRLLLGLGIISVALIGCSPPVYSVRSQPSAIQPLPSTHIYFYPAHGQTKSKQERDRYECYLWAVKRSGFNPGHAPMAPHQRVVVTPIPPSGADTAAGAVGGAIVGSMISPHDDRGLGMVFGAITGAMLGAASDAARQQQAEQIQRQHNSKDSLRYTELEKQARAYKRAMAACLEGRGYTVR